MGTVNATMFAVLLMMVMVVVVVLFLVAPFHFSNPLRTWRYLLYTASADIVLAVVVHALLSIFST